MTVRVLVVDDEPQILRAMRVSLTARQFEVAMAATGGSALKQASDWQPDVVVLDKPFDIEELLARIRAITRRAGGPDALEPPRVRMGDHTVDLAAKTVSGDVHLTPTEWHLLELLVRNSGKLVGQRQILTDLWGAKDLTNTHCVRQYMAQLRRKLERDPSRPIHVITAPGMGCRFSP